MISIGLHSTPATLRIVARHRTVVVGCFIESRWDDQTISLPSLRQRDGFYGLGSISYPTKEVLNDRFDNSFALNRGQIVEGVVLAYGCEPIPLEIRAGVVPVRSNAD